MQNRRVWWSRYWREEGQKCGMFIGDDKKAVIVRKCVWHHQWQGWVTTPPGATGSVRGHQVSGHQSKYCRLKNEKPRYVITTFKRDSLFISIHILSAPTPLAWHCPGLLLVRQLPGHPPPAPALHGSAPVTLSRLIPSCQARLVTWGRLSRDNLRISSSHKSRLFLVTESFVSPSLIKASSEAGSESIRRGEWELCDMEIQIRCDIWKILARLFWHTDIMTHCFWIW